MGRYSKSYNIRDHIPEVCIIGAGFSGLCAAVQLKRKLNLKNFTVYESHNEVGGCWFANTYPGCACSIPSLVYAYSFAPKTDWSHQFANQSEILEYLKSVAREYDIYKNIKLGCEVRQLTWKEEIKKWSVRIFDKVSKVEYEILYDIVISGTGPLRIPNKPKEFLSFKGPIIHSAEWDDSVKLEGKCVAVVGSGQSALQLIPNISKHVSKLLAYQRTPGWVFPLMQTKYPSFVKWALTHVPGLQRALRFSYIHSSDLGSGWFIRGTVISRSAFSTVASLLNVLRRLEFRKYPDLRKTLAPTHTLGCKPPGLSDEYYSTFKLPHVKLITGKISEVRENSIVTEDGAEEKIDVIVLATGFRTQDFFAPMEIIGRNSRNILPKWRKNGPSGYLGIISGDMPNHFILLAPGTFAALFIYQIESQVNFVIKVLKEMLKRNAKVVSVKESVESEYKKQIEKVTKKSFFVSPECDNVSTWARFSGMIITAVYPGSSLSYRKRTRCVDDSKFNFT